MKIRLVLAAGLIALASGAEGCRGSGSNEPPVATPGVSVNHPRAPLGSPIEMTYRFAVAPDARLTENYHVLVHFLDSDEELMWTDDHDPPVPTSQWTPGQKIEYTRTMFVPIYPYIGQAWIQMGLYRPGAEGRLPLAGDDRGQRAYRVGTLLILPQTENVFLIYKEGWHPAEIASDNSTVEWQWTKKEATLVFRNPRRDALFYLHLDSDPRAFPDAKDAQTVALKVGDQVVATFPVKEETIRKVPLSATELGTADMVELRIQVDRTFVPAQLPAANSRDPRELGVRVFHAFIEPK